MCIFDINQAQQAATPTIDHQDRNIYPFQYIPQQHMSLDQTHITWLAIHTILEEYVDHMSIVHRQTQIPHIIHNVAVALDQPHKHTHTDTHSPHHFHFAKYQHKNNNP